MESAIDEVVEKDVPACCKKIFENLHSWYPMNLIDVCKRFGVSKRRVKEGMLSVST